LPSGGQRDAFISGLAELGVNAVFHYVPLHSSAAGRKHGRAAGPLPVSDRLSERLVRLPLWVGMSEADVDRVIEVASATAEAVVNRAAVTASGAR
jgi:dTDP-4-amino-4,6-dideoxygalactose transaminase